MLRFLKVSMLSGVSSFCVSMAVSASSFQSSLNPNAPYFFPASFSAAEDFSPEWWHLVQTCPAFREYWLVERFDPEILRAPDTQFSIDADLFTDLDFEDADLEENLSPLSGLNLNEAGMKSGLKQVIGGAKQIKHAYYPLPYQAKPLKDAHPQKPILRKIQQPR